jgi:hypothetical protein
MTRDDAAAVAASVVRPARFAAPRIVSAEADRGGDDEDQEREAFAFHSTVNTSRS